MAGSTGLRGGSGCRVDPGGFGVVGWHGIGADSARAGVGQIMFFECHHPAGLGCPGQLVFAGRVGGDHTTREFRVGNQRIRGRAMGGKDTAHRYDWSPDAGQCNQGTKKNSQGTPRPCAGPEPGLASHQGAPMPLTPANSQADLAADWRILSRQSDASGLNGNRTPRELFTTAPAPLGPKAGFNASSAPPCAP